MKAYKYGIGSIAIIDEKKFIEMNECEVFTYYTSPDRIGCERAGCYSPSNKSANFKEGDEERHTKCVAFNFFDGGEWRSVILHSNYRAPNFVECASEESDAIIKAWESAEFKKSRFGMYAETEAYNFDSTGDPLDPFEARVEVK